MKKIIIIAAVAMTAVASQAATALWSATGGNFFDGTGSTATSAKWVGDVYIFDVGVLTQSALYDAYAANSAYDFGKNAVATLDVANGAIVTSSSANYFNYGNPGDKYGFYAVLVDTDKIYFSNIKADLTATESTTVPKGISFSTQNNSTSTFSATAPSGSGFAGEGKWSAVPEPTSGLLLLLGMAGLALRRRRA